MRGAKEMCRRLFGAGLPPGTGDSPAVLPVPAPPTEKGVHEGVLSRGRTHRVLSESGSACANNKMQK